MENQENHALVFGATGLIGWAVVDQLLSGYPDAGLFSKVTAVSNRPFDASDTLWPNETLERPKLQVVSGVDLQSHDLTSQMRQKVSGVDSVTHIIYFGG